jgi:hypothetical protein
MITAVTTHSLIAQTPTPSVSNNTDAGLSVPSPGALLMAAAVSVLSLAGKHWFDVWAESRRSAIALAAEREKAQIKVGADTASIASTMTQKMVQNLLEEDDDQLDQLTASLKEQAEIIGASMRSMAVEHRALKEFVSATAEDTQSAMQEVKSEVSLFRVMLEAALIEFNAIK